MPVMTEANARLIASAPDLLAALRGMVALWDGLPDGDTPNRARAPAALATARRALDGAAPTTTGGA